MRSPFPENCKKTLEDSSKKYIYTYARSQNAIRHCDCHECRFDKNFAHFSAIKRVTFSDPSSSRVRYILITIYRRDPRKMAVAIKEISRRR